MQCSNVVCYVPIRLTLFSMTVLLTKAHNAALSPNSSNNKVSMDLNKFNCFNKKKVKDKIDCDSLNL